MTTVPHSEKYGIVVACIVSVIILAGIYGGAYIYAYGLNFP